jgi:signal peptide peptidase SppA
MNTEKEKGAVTKGSGETKNGKSSGVKGGLQPFNLLRWRDRGPLVPVVRLTGAIGMASPLRPGLSLANCAGVLGRAFSYRNAAAVAIAINSPGGSPVQSRLIYSRIRALAEEKDLPVYFFCEDVTASGGYMLALAGDEIYADPSSIIGSIGVIAAGFGFDKAIERLGVDRRVYTAGRNKLSLDPFQPEKPEDVKRLKAIQNEVHELFKAMVRERRGEKLTASEDKLFNGEFWAGTTALELGLIDGLGDMRAVMRDKFGDKARLKLVASSRNWLRRNLAFPGMYAGTMADGEGASFSLPAGWTDEVLSTLEIRALWSRYGF